jgi:hypothetical protein
MEQVRVDFLIVANHAEVVNGLLYLSGGGWTDHHRIVRTNQPPPISHLGVGVSVVVPWTETNRPHMLTVGLEDQDGSPIMTLQANFKVGRPPQLPEGAEQPILLAFPLDLAFPHTGEYRVIAHTDQEDENKHWNFRVYDVAL